ncbi:MAG TPA: nucleoside-diphosphate sugar epimerase [Acidimicrobiaceae bacterium]|nr:nucleoside-diphosphate sugar epimerase [Acidimicrobiaceae bacterium]HCV33291.1 nucleoside-diphosphate sugar epimerase [Acidimicrobiaceae bacterium]|tara:strand:- start:12832 stop:13791 length:960 start_codon:yes stop_codon:yes gene_type:complete
MRALITGGAGFIGSHLADRLLARGDQVVLLDDLSTGRLANIAHLEGDPDAEFVLGSILNPDLVDHVVSRVDAIYHLAAAVGVNLIVEKPLESLMTNIRGTETVVEKAHKYGKRVLVASTSEIYGKNTSDRLSEDDDRILGSPLKSRWSYSEAKAIDEILAYTYWREKGLETVIVRLFNTVGPRQTGSYGMVIPRFVTQALRGEPITVFGDGRQTRCFCSVHDVVVGILALSENSGAIGRVFNLGGTEEISMADLAAKIVGLAGSTSTIEYVPYDVAYEEGFEDMERRVPDTTRAHELVGFAPTASLDDIISAVIEDQRR